MKPMAVGMVVAMVVIAPFVGGMFFTNEVQKDGPAEELGEVIDEAASQ